MSESFIELKRLLTRVKSMMKEEEKVEEIKDIETIFEASMLFRVLEMHTFSDIMIDLGKKKFEQFKEKYELDVKLEPKNGKQGS